MIHRHKWTTEDVEPDGGRSSGQCRDCTRCAAHQCYTIVEMGRRKMWITTRYRNLQSVSVPAKEEET